MAIFFLIPPDASGPQVNGVNVCVVSANNGADGKAACKAMRSGDISAAAWDAANQLNLTTQTFGIGSFSQGWRFNVKVLKITAPFALVADVTYTSGGFDGHGAVGNGLVTLLNAGIINGAAYDSGGRVLTIASAGDGIGDHRVECSLWTPRVNDGAGVERTERVAVSANFWSSLVHEGAAGAALSVVLPQDSFQFPVVHGQFFIA